ncbi:methyltransferase domain-containing protein [Candidatus Gribaldobacteria bacterium]|nr:methyltransferase domain-containing protein [Candidatus Gribaldobacteria bacterium]
MVYCYTVLEHVKDIEKCLREMLRIAKPGGLIYLNTPDYSYPEERHYKIRFPFGPANLPRFFSYVYLLLRCLPCQFFKSLNLLTKKQLNKILQKLSCSYNFEIKFLSPAISSTQELLLKKT